MASNNEKGKAATSTRPIAFHVTAPTAREDGVRLGTLIMQGRIEIRTPHYLALSSRGAVPHVSQDLMREDTALKGIYTALEDCE